MRTYDENSSYEEPAIDSDTRENINPKVKSTVGASMKSLLNWGELRRGSKFVNVMKQYKAFAMAKSADITPDRLEKRWKEMENDKFWQDKGFDWLDVVNTFDKRP